ncbi:uncharacterized protein LOC117651487 [Thrips palmi]|uniref:Uncharacterized protein LOC117651487 n=1 Tax=Thrips palmi TaxID=161013 RepID=A0A6P9A114_THRPL|nr:uncharacterized protein LOC117651487 [Thrips palmi]
MVAALWTLLAALFGSACGTQGPEKQAHVFEIKPLELKVCPEVVQQESVSVHNFSIVRWGNNYQAWFDVVMPKPVATISKASLKLVQCLAGKPCKHFYTMRFTAGVCAIVADRFAFWSPLFSGAQPPFQCPLDKKLYHFRNASVEMSHFLSLFSATSSTINREAIWSGKLEAWDEQSKEFACLNMKLSYS